jgi:hypothetical protein
MNLREQRVKARRNNKELLREEVEFLKQYLNISRVRTGQVAEGQSKIYFAILKFSGK